MLNIALIKYDCDEDHYNALRIHQDKYIKNNDALKESILVHLRSTEATQHRDGGVWTHGTILEHDIQTTIVFHTG